MNIMTMAAKILEIEEQVPQSIRPSLRHFMEKHPRIGAIRWNQGCNREFETKIGNFGYYMEENRDTYKNVEDQEFCEIPYRDAYREVNGLTVGEHVDLRDLVLAMKMFTEHFEEAFGDHHVIYLDSNGEFFVHKDCEWIPEGCS